MYTFGLSTYAQGKTYIVVLTRNDGTIGKVQRAEVKYLQTCHGQRFAGPNMYICKPDFSYGAHLMAMTFRTFVAWFRCDLDPQKLGHPLPASCSNQWVAALPNLHTCETEFQRLVALA